MARGLGKGLNSLIPEIYDEDFDSNSTQSLEEMLEEDINTDEKPEKIKPKFSVRVRRFYRNNRIYCILMGISFASIVLIILALLAHFIHQNTSNPYGNRLEDIKNYPVQDNINETKTKTEENELVENVSIEVKGKSK